MCLAWQCVGRSFGRTRVQASRSRHDFDCYKPGSAHIVAADTAPDGETRHVRCCRNWSKINGEGVIFDGLRPRARGGDFNRYDLRPVRWTGK